MPLGLFRTSTKNATSALFFRYFLLYLLATPIAFLGNNKIVTAWVSGQNAGLCEFLFIALALSFAFSTLAKPLFILVTVLKSFFDVTLFRGALTDALGRKIGILPLNALFLYLATSLSLFAFCAARASLFPHVNAERDSALLFSRAFFLYLLEALAYLALATLLFFFWHTLSPLLGM